MRAIFLALALLGGNAWAARPGKVDVDEAALRSAPQATAPVKKALPRATRLEASNEPIEGYYKVRLETGEIGFVSSRELDLAPLEPLPPLAGAFSSGAARPAGSPARFVSVRAAAGVGFGHFPALNSLIGFDRYSNPVNGSLEVAIRVRPSWALVLGGDVFTQSLTMSGTVVKSTATVTRTYAFSGSAWLARTGLAFLLVDEGDWLVELGAMGALAPSIAVSAQLTAADPTDVSAAAPNTTTLSGLGFGAVARLLAQRRVWSRLGLAAEGGFRFVQTAAVTPASSPHGSDLFMENAAFVPVSLQLVGFYAQAGLSWAL